MNDAEFSYLLSMGYGESCPMCVKDRSLAFAAGTIQSVCHLDFEDILFLQKVLLCIALIAGACGGLALSFQPSSLRCAL